MPTHHPSWTLEQFSRTNKSLSVGWELPRHMLEERVINSGEMKNLGEKLLFVVQQRKFIHWIAVMGGSCCRVTKLASSRDEEIGKVACNGGWTKNVFNLGGVLCLRRNLREKKDSHTPVGVAGGGKKSLLSLWRRRAEQCP